MENSIHDRKKESDAIRIFLDCIRVHLTCKYYLRLRILEIFCIDKIYLKADVYEIEEIFYI